MKKILMYLSAFLPMFIIMFIRDLSSLISDVLNGDAKWPDLNNPLIIGEIIFIAIVSIAFLYLMKNNKNRTTRQMKIVSLNNRSAEYYLGYYSVFLLSLISFSLLDLVDVITLALLMIVLGVVYIKNGLFFMNPTINIFQSMIYEVETESGDKKLIISKHKLKPEETIEIEVSDFEFTFMRRIVASRNINNT